MMKQYATRLAAILAMAGATGAHAAVLTNGSSVVDPIDLRSLLFNEVTLGPNTLSLRDWSTNLASLYTPPPALILGDPIFQPPQFPPVTLSIGAALSCTGGTINIDTTSNVNAALSCNGDLLVTDGEISVTGGLLMALNINATGSLVIGQGATLTSLSGMSLASGAGGIVVESGATLNGSLWLFSQGNVTIREGAVLNSGSGVAYAPVLSVGGETVLPGGQVTLASGSVISLVPEAGTLPMIGLGLGVVALAHRRRVVRSPS